MNLRKKSEKFGLDILDSTEIESVTARIRKIEVINPLVPLACQYLTPKKIESLRYNSTDVKNAVNFELPETQTALKKAIKKSFIVRETYTNEIAKRMFQNILDRLKIKKTAKAVDLTKYLNVEGKKVAVNNGKRKDGFKIISYY